MATTYSALPAPSPGQGLSRYLTEIRKFPMLEPEQEFMLAKAWVDHGDRDAAHQLVTSHLRLAAKIARMQAKTPKRIDVTRAVRIEEWRRGRRARRNSP